MMDAAAIRLRWEAVGSKQDERGRRLFAAAEVRAAGRSGLALASKITGLARSTINRGEDDLDGEPLPAGPIRRKGGDRRAIGDEDPRMREQLRRLVEPATLGDPISSADLGVEEPDETGLGAHRDGPSGLSRDSARRSC